MHYNDKDTESMDMEGVHEEGTAEQNDKENIDFDYYAKDYPIMEHMSNARLMPMTGPYGRLDLFDTYEYGTVPIDPKTPLESYEVVMKKNRQK